MDHVKEPPTILPYLAAAYRVNPDAEVSGLELERALGLDSLTVRREAAELARQGFVEWDPLLSNVWLRITDKGLAAIEGEGPLLGPMER
jgi:DNA-binding MarR family transcriptional regulator